MRKFICGVDLGGTKINTGIINDEGKIIESIKLPTLAQEGPEAVIDRIKKSIYEVLRKSKLRTEDLAGIGIGSPGPINSDRGIIVYSSNLPGWHDVHLVERIKSEFNTEVRLNNDANVAALGEYTFGSGRGTRNFVYMTVSTGIGGGIVIDGKLYNGANSNSAEIGHTTINFNGPKCNCGNYGCLEVYASGTAIGRIAREELKKGKISIISDISMGTLPRAEHVFEAANRGDELALEIVKNEAFYLGIGIANIITFYNPEMIAIGGGVSKGWDLLRDRTLEIAKMKSLGPSFDVCKVVKAQLGEDIGILGAAALIKK